jgi:EAL domain-containing protein (putative c-di-GMP-specific phosphodiesterase class I)
VLRTACAEAASWPAHVRVAINVSPIQFKSRTLSLKVPAALAETGLDPRRLELEITEAVLIADDDAALVALNQLRALGVHIALDDFGTGYSSLQYLQRFPLDKSRSTAVLSRKSPATPAWRRSSARSSALPPTAT